MPLSLPTLPDLTRRLPWGGSKKTSPKSRAGEDPSSNGQAGPSESNEESGEGISPFLEARSHVTNLFRKQAKEKHQYLTLCLIVGAALILSVAANVYLATSVRMKRYIVPVNTQTGEVYEAGFAQPLEKASEQVVAGKIEAVIEGLRNVYVDRRATTRGYLDAYRYVAEESDAASFLNDFLSKDRQHPLEQVGELQRAVVEISALPIAGTRSWRVEWAENTIRRDGRATQAVYEGTVSVRHRTREDDADALAANPAGVYIDGATWSEKKTRILGRDTSSPPAAPPAALSSPSSDGATPPGPGGSDAAQD